MYQKWKHVKTRFTTAALFLKVDIFESMSVPCRFYRFYNSEEISFADSSKTKLENYF